MTSDEMLANPLIRDSLKRQHKVRVALAAMFAALVECAKADNGSLYDAARVLTAEMPKAAQAEAMQMFHKVIDDYREKVADAAMWPNGKPVDESLVRYEALCAKAAE